LRTRYGVSPWIDQLSSSRVPDHPRLREPQATDVVIVGAGLTGCATAYACALAGLKTIVIEAGRIGQAGSGRSAGLLLPEPGPAFRDLEQAHGLRAARTAFESWRRASLDAASLLRRLNIRCGLDPVVPLLVATRDDEKKLRREFEARAKAGIEGTWLTRKLLGKLTAPEAPAAIRMRDAFTLDPYRACVGLAGEARERGVKIFERSPVRRITFTRKHADVFTAGGAIRTRRVVVTIGMPTATLFRSLARHFWFRSTYLAMTEPIPARVRQQLGRRESTVRDSAEPPHIVQWVDDDRLMICGADAEAPPVRQRDKVIVQRTGQLMYEMSTLYPVISGIQPAYGWMADYARTDDGLPYIGAHRNFPHHLFAFGDSSRSVTGSYLASRILLRQCSGEMDPADEAFGFHR